MNYTIKGHKCICVIAGKETPIVSGSWEITVDLPWYKWAWLMVMRLFKPFKFHMGTSGRGGRRPGAGRPKGSKDKVVKRKSNRGGYRPGSGPKKGTKYKPRAAKSAQGAGR